MTTITEQVRAAAEEIAQYADPRFASRAEATEGIIAIITKHVHPASLAEPKKLVDEIDDLLSEAIGYDYTNRGPAMIALERLVERNSAPVGPSLTDAIEVVRDYFGGLLAMHVNRDELLSHLESLQGKAPVSDQAVKVHNCGWKGLVRPYPAVLCSMCKDQGESDASLEELCRWYSDLAAATPSSGEAPMDTPVLKACNGTPCTEPSHNHDAGTWTPEQQSPRVCVKCNHAEHWSSNHHHRCAFLYTSMDGGSTCSCMCVFPESEENKIAD